MTGRLISSPGRRKGRLGKDWVGPFPVSPCKRGGGCLIGKIATQLSLQGPRVPQKTLYSHPREDPSQEGGLCLAEGAESKRRIQDNKPPNRKVSLCFWIDGRGDIPRVWSKKSKWQPDSCNRSSASIPLKNQVALQARLPGHRPILPPRPADTPGEHKRRIQLWFNKPWLTPHWKPGLGKPEGRRAGLPGPERAKRGGGTRPLGNGGVGVSLRWSPAKEAADARPGRRCAGTRWRSG